MSVIFNMLVTISSLRLLLTTVSMFDTMGAPLVELNQTVLSATLSSLLSEIVQLNTASVPSQNVRLAGC